MLLVRGLLESSPTEEVLVTGAGDGVVKLWRLDQDEAPSEMAALENGDPVLALASTDRSSTVVCPGVR